MRYLLLLSLFFVACASTPKTDSGPSVTAGGYAPLVVGAERTYSMDYLGQKGEMTVKILKKEEGYFMDDQGGAFRHTDQGLRDKQRYLIKHPLQVGNTWKTIVSASAVEHNKIISVGEPCTSKAGTFSDCLVVEAHIRRDKNVTLRIRWNWAKGIGLVKFETEIEDATRGRIPQTKQSLVHYKLGDAPKDDGPDSWSK